MDTIGGGNGDIISQKEKTRRQAVASIAHRTASQQTR